MSYVIYDEDRYTMEEDGFVHIYCRGEIYEDGDGPVRIGNLYEDGTIKWDGVGYGWFAFKRDRLDN